MDASEGQSIPSSADDEQSKRLWELVMRLHDLTLVFDCKVRHRDQAAGAPSDFGAFRNYIQQQTAFVYLRLCGCLVCLQGCISWASPASARVLGYHPADLLGQHLALIVAPECHEAFEGHVKVRTYPLVGALT